MRLVVWSLQTGLLLLQWFPPLYGHFFLVFHFLQLFPAKDQVRLREIFSFTHFFPSLVTDFLLNHDAFQLKCKKAFAYRILPSFCFSSCNNRLHSFLKLTLNSRDMKTTFFSNLLCNILFCELLLHYSHEKLPLTLPELNMLNILSFFFSYRKENHVLFSQVLQRKFCERGLFQGFFEHWT